ncbi:MAG: thiamine pyrophosphate-dependent dehydrogenase E1 component subunit alpha, partial [Candidatus Hodarchaeales archaeon]
FFRGFPLQDLINHWFNTENDPQKGRRLPGLFGSVKYRYVNPSAPIGTQIIQAAGAAYATRYLKKNDINIVFFGDGATSSNDFHSGLNFGAVYNVPTIFFCQNNQWAISVPLSQQTASKSIVSKAEGYGMYGIQIDGNDVLAVYKAVTDAATKARSGEGPTFIEAVTYRIGPHTSSDDPTRYRPKKELEEWKKRDPISRFEKYLIKKEIVNEDHRKNTLDKFNQEIDALIASAEKLPPPKLETMFSDVYQSTPWHLEEQKTDLLNSGARNEK